MSGLRDTSFLQNSINKNKGKGINMPKNLIEEVVKQHKNDTEKKNITSIASDKVQMNTDLIKLQEKLKALELENKNLKISANYNLTTHEEKLLNAIRSEILSQDINEPVMTRGHIRKNYGIGEKYLGAAIKGLEDKGLITRSKARTKLNQLSFQWKIISK